MIHVIGVGPGRPEWVPQATHDIVAQCDAIVGSSRVLHLFPELRKGSYHLSGDMVQSLQLVANLLEENMVVGVLVSGDPGFFSFLAALRREFTEEVINAHPGLSAVQFAFARAGIPWQDASFASVHGRDLASLPRTILKPLAVLTGGNNTPQKVAQLLLERGINPRISVGNSLCYPEEVWETLDAEQLARYPQPLSNAILIIYPTFPQNPWQDNALRIGIPDREFIRGEVPMTKAEIRVQVLAKAQISLHDHILDVGAGTGSIAIEAAALAGEGIVYAVENDPEAQELIRANQRKFAVSNLQLVAGTAPEIFARIPPVDVCIIGGSRGRLAAIIEKAPLVQGGRLVMTAVTLENTLKGLEALERLNFADIETISIQAVRWPKISDLHMAQSLNQIFITSARKGGEL
ncbi:cobalt-precorrin-7 (C15)-methyltransferase [decarboxylating]/trimethylsulfonium-tetrahydrofolate N-methyltransferase [Acididesulfobacillus acetoxydans]|uniref:Cobalt-precorrin-7 (C15)-methyltransferase [decarboxylating]/trimethylsulfonium-tetrahydrofolate N-methyltransferase n=1 Tax=Acididesulfobacillus acetoxydans TaxID=1561005 RepID=A0A8S0WGH9_9FIRM|nr:precorrin-6y C5,15-methyltransferase (decarboxylating) subunit CbiE [Acididesulfobacillus acetoxydans]CAA7601902.1 cobalt-precorrin-7 (C15)-methyltransferase [decarboxylating]/trimethylsulfonium-tetrahydrofolate N-methyltransferase [Acididesulfobacillus acetoxydans]CEJ08254.1 Precorrin-6Y C5,15-methyltransferase (Decarboxylating), CbiT subunit [Acididesulfobacillus acetoxydans]